MITTTMKLLTILAAVIVEIRCIQALNDEPTVCLNCQQLLAILNQQTAKVQRPKAEVTTQEWKLAFRGTANIGKSVYAAFKDGTGIPSEVEPGCKQVSEPLPCSNHYRNKDVIDNWDRVKEVSFILYSNYKKVKEMLFDGTGTTYLTWFDKAKVKFSTWKDVKTSVTNYFSIPGDFRPQIKVMRTFFINGVYFSCPNDKGWFVAIDVADSPCQWEKSTVFPVFKYARQNQAENWNNGDVGTADMFAIFVKFYDTP